MGTLVTGGQGFIGSWLVTRLLERGERVVVPARAAHAESLFARERLWQRTNSVELDLGDIEGIHRTLVDHGIETVFHLAGQTLVGAANESPAETFATNVQGTWNLLEACRRASETVTRVVVSSSYHVYGRHDGAYREDFPLRPTYPYDVSKACADLIAQSYARTYGLPVGVLRQANVYGGGDLHFSRLVPAAARALARGKAPTIRSDGTPERDFLYVEDAADAYLAVEGALGDPARFGSVWNAGSGRAVAILDLIEQLIAASGQSLVPEVQGRQQARDEIDRQVLDSSAIARDLGWTPRHHLGAGLRKTWDWYGAVFT